MKIQWGKSTITLPIEVAQQVHIFSSDIATYRAQSFKEAKVRSDFINIVFSHLGWNMDNNGLLFNQREVEQEDSLDIEGKKKSPDYAFLANGRRKFYVEAKAPHVPVLTNTESAYQIRNYSWNNSLPFGNSPRMWTH